MPKKIGTLGAMLSISGSTPSKPVISRGSLSSSIQNKRMFSYGRVCIGTFIIPLAKILWDTGSKQTFVYVSSRDKLDVAPLGTFPVSGIGAEVMATAYSARIDLSDILAFDDLIVGVMIGDEEADDGSYESADVILGMDAIQYGELSIHGQDRVFTFSIK